MELKIWLSPTSNVSTSERWILTNRVISIVGNPYQTLSFFGTGALADLTNTTLQMTSLTVVGFSLNATFADVKASSSLILSNVSVQQFYSETMAAGIQTRMGVNHIRLENVSFVNCTCNSGNAHGGAISVVHTSEFGDMSLLVMKDVEFQGNSANNSRGGALGLSADGSPLMIQTMGSILFKDNNAGSGGALSIMPGNSYVEISGDRSDWTFLGSSSVGPNALGFGAAIRIDSAAVIDVRKILVSGSMFGRSAISIAVPANSPMVPTSSLRVREDLTISNNEVAGLSIASSFLIKSDRDILVESSENGIEISNENSIVSITARNHIEISHNDGYGGGLMISDTSNLTLSADSIAFFNNKAMIGSAVNMFDAKEGAYLVIKSNNLTFSSNYADEIGGAICFPRYSFIPVTLKLEALQLNFINNTAKVGGAIFSPDRDFIMRLYSSPSVSFIGNHADRGCVVSGRWNELGDFPGGLALPSSILATFKNNTVSPEKDSAQWSALSFRNPAEEYACVDIVTPVSSCRPKPSIGDPKHWHLGSLCLWEYFEPVVTASAFPSGVMQVNQPLWFAGNVDASELTTINITYYNHGLSTLCVKGNFTNPKNITLSLSRSELSDIYLMQPVPGNPSHYASEMDIIELDRKVFGSDPVIIGSVLGNSSEYLTFDYYVSRFLIGRTVYFVSTLGLNITSVPPPSNVPNSNSNLNPNPTPVLPILSPSRKGLDLKAILIICAIVGSVLVVAFLLSWVGFIMMKRNRTAQPALPINNDYTMDEDLASHTYAERHRQVPLSERTPLLDKGI